MTNIIASIITVITMIISIAITGTNAQPSTDYQMTEDQQMEIYEQVMDECILSQNPE